MDVAVIGAGGQTGRPLLAELLSRGASVRAVTRHVASLDDVGGLTDAVRGAGVVHYIPPTFSPDEVAFGRNVIAAVEAAGVPRLVYHSVMHANTREMPHHWRKHRVEGLLRESRLEWTVLQPAMYAETPLQFLNAARTRLSLGFDPDAEFTPVTLADLSEATATVLLDGEGRHAGESLELAGSERLTHREMARQMSETWGHRVAIRRLPSALVAAVASRRYGPGSRRVIKAMLDHYDRAGFTGDATTLRGLLGREPAPFCSVLPSR